MDLLKYTSQQAKGLIGCWPEGTYDLCKNFHGRPLTNGFTGTRIDPVTKLRGLTTAANSTSQMQFVGTSKAIDNNIQFSITCRAFVTSDAQSDLIGNNGTTNVSRTGFLIFNSTVFACVENGAPAYAQGVTIPPVNQWTTFGLTFNGANTAATRIKLYQNGKLDATSSVQTGPTVSGTSGTDLYTNILSSLYGSNTQVDLRLYNHELTADDMYEIHVDPMDLYHVPDYTDEFLLVLAKTILPTKTYVLVN